MYAPFSDLPVWAYILIALALTHVTIASVTIYLHRNQAHRALELHPLAAHFFRFWLWLTTATVTREWIAVHRKHHAHVESPEDPHSPQVRGIHSVLWGGFLLYRREASKAQTLDQYGFGAPHDWIENHVYTPAHFAGIFILLSINILLLGPLAGGLIWLTQMLWIPFWAAGVVNGLGHYFGYRNYQLADASRNIVPWGVIVGGEELHNNHHAYASSAKFSARRWELDLGWVYIRLLHRMRLATIKKIAPELVCEAPKPQCDLETARAVLASRFQVMSNFVREVLLTVCREEMRKVGRGNKEHWTLLKQARRLMVRETSNLDEVMRNWLKSILEINPRLKTVYAMKQRLQEIWSRSASTQENLRAALEEWCRAAEASGIEALRRFSSQVRGYTLAPVVR